MELEEPEIVDFVGVVLGREDNFYNVYRITVVDGKPTLREVPFGSRRLKKSAIRIASLDLVAISQEITGHDIQFVLDLNEEEPA